MTDKSSICDAATLDPIDPALDPVLDRLSRRTLLGRAGAGGVVAAALGTNANANEPQHALDDPSLDKGMTTVTVHADGQPATEIKAFLATPKPPGKRAGVIVIHEIFGVTDHIKDVASRLAQAGYTALAPDLFTREGAPPPMSGGFGPMMEFVNKIPDSQLMNDLKACIHMLKSRPDSNKRVGCVGFCYGGRISMLLDAAAPDLNAAVAYYGGISGPKSANQPAYPIDLVEKFHAPLLGNYGAEDTGIPPAEADKLRTAMKDHHKRGDIYVYEHAGHAFNNDTREAYRPEAAALAWSRTLAFFKENLH